ncbi:group 1 glycosyl transferase [Hyphomonas johnsonii MHS-2]|uniref:Group 1 glycosyl transferase n=2 Tax=Hyphomonas johnsonii TaxID=81031 RepID=A0A059FAD9_9PROT|nr:group 1 glycosyl transferase [Hyphomonas johnsonii MHS-2]
MRTACFTICSRNYLAYALTLRESLLAVEPGRDFFIFLADSPLDDPSQLPGVVAIPAADLSLANFQDMAFRYSIMEFNTAIKASCFQHLLRKLDYDAAIYIDPDIQLFQPFDQVHAALENGASCVLTPHILSPLRDSAKPSDLDILASGTFNLGFGAFARTAESLAFLEWWAETMKHHCYVDLANGLFVDQRFMDFAPSFIDALTVIKDPGYNVAYWNLANRPVRKEDGIWMAAGSPLVFFHFSGVSPGSPDVFSKHQSRFDMTNIGDAAELVRNYTAALEDHGHAHWSTLPYAFGQFANGKHIVDVMRRGPPVDPSDPFREPNHVWWSTPTDRVDSVPGLTITRLMYAIHAARPDLMEMFPLSTASGQRGFHAWFITHGAQEYRIEKTSLEPAMAASPVRNRQLARLFARLRLARSRKPSGSQDLS